MSDPINPGYYKDLAVEPIDAIEAWGLGYRLGSAVKYIARAGRKGPAVEDLRKAQWFLAREIATLEKSPFPLAGEGRGGGTSERGQEDDDRG